MKMEEIDKAFERLDKEKLELETVLREVAPIGFDLLKRFKQAWYDQSAMQNYLKLNPDFKKVQEAIKADLSKILTEVETIEFLFNEGNYKLCKETLKTVQSKYKEVLEKIDEKEDELELPDKIKLNKDNVYLTKVINEYEDKLNQFTDEEKYDVEVSEEVKEKFDKLIAFSEKYIKDPDASKYSPDKVCTYIKRTLKDYSDLAGTKEYKTLVELNEEIANLPIPAEVISENNKKSKKKKKRKK
ncbi:hypothetical protein GF374_00340 [Candidatus Woesearchaeota archaeon]|nr:hypothetical protein [Candidatus Woesearchaeota archaeon]